MAHWLVKRRLKGMTSRLRALREELHVVDEQIIYMADDADDDRLRSMVSESPLDAKTARESGRHASTMSDRRAAIVQQIAELERRQDELLDQLGS